jgi:methionine-rich copper-binding protein CopC
VRRAGFLAGAVLGAAILAGAPAAPAFAHNYPVEWSPDEDSTVDVQPDVVSLTTNDALLDFEDTASMDVIGPDDLHYATDCAAVSGATVAVAAALGTPGDYTVEWSAVSADGHPISGAWVFTWAPSDGVELATGAADPVCASTASGSTDAASDPAPESEASDPSPDASAADATADLLWVVGAVAVAGIAGVVAWLLVRRRGSNRPEPSRREPDLPEPDLPDPDRREPTG